VRAKANSIAGVLTGALLAVVILYAIGLFAGPIAGVGILPYSKESTSGRLGGWIHGIWLALAIVVPAAGGYVAATIAKRQPLLHAAMVGVVGGIAVLAVATTWLMVVYALALFPPSAAVGGWFWRRRHGSGREQSGR
jgi:hypothetical protein